MNRTSRLLVAAALLAFAASAAWHWTPGGPPSRSTAGAVASKPDHASESKRPVATAVAASAPPAASTRTIAAPAAGRDALTAFEGWVGAVIQPNHVVTSAELATGTRLAQLRRAALKQLIASDPQAALAHAVSRGVRQRLPADIVRELETPVDAFGAFEVVAVCGPHSARTDRWTTIGSHTYATYTYGARLATLSKNRLAIHGIALDGTLALSDRPYATLEAGVPTVAGSGLTVAVGDTMRTFASAEALDAWTAATQQAEQTANPAATAADTAGWTTGEKTVLWIRAEFTDDPGSPGTDDQITAGMAAADTLYRDVSHNTCSLKTTILPGTLILPSTKASYAATSSGYLALRSDALQLARDYDAANGGTGKYNPDNYDRYIVVTKKVSNWTWSGIATVGNKGASLNGTCYGATAAHELGHNQGLRHSHAWAPTAGNPIGAGTHIEYGDAFDDMGSGQFRDNGGHFNVVQKYKLGYLTDSSVQTITQSGTYRIFRHDDRAASGIQALKIATAFAGTSYWLEYRHAAPYPQFSPPAAGTDELPRLQHGVVFHWDTGPSFTSGAGTYLLDMTPGTTSGVLPPTDPSTDTTALLNDAALAEGETFSDPAINLMVTPVQAGGTAPNEWIDVYISLGAVTGNHSPTLVAPPPVGAIDAHTDVTFSASASDPDGDPVYYRWDFGDGLLAPSAATVTHHWSKGGTYTVTCTAVDGRGGSASTSYSVTVDDPMLNWQQRAASLTTHYFYDVLFDGTQFAAIGSFVGATSPNGIDWTLGSGLSRTYNLSLAYGGGRYVTVGTSSTVLPAATILTSTDGLSWSDESPAGLPQLLSVTYGGNRFVAVGDSGTILTSPDGVDWTNVSTTNTGNLKVVRYGGGRFVAAGASGAFLTSTDGVQWQDVSLSGETGTTYALSYFHHAWLGVTGNYLLADTSKRIGWTSPDGLTWTKTYVPVNSSLTDTVPIANGNLLLGLSRLTEGQIFIGESPDHWASASVYPATGSGMYFTGAAEGNETVVVVGLNGQIYTPVGRPFVATPPANTTVTAGDIATFDASGYATGPFTFQWLKNGAPIADATNSTYAVANVGAGDVASYSAIISNSAGSTTTPAAQLLVTSAGPTVNPSRLSNVSVRSTAGTGDQTLIVGVSIGAGADGVAKPLLVRAVGPTLAAYLPNALATPVLSAYQLNAPAPLATNDGWRGDVRIAAVAKAVNAFSLDPTSGDAALFRSFTSGGYTMQVTGGSGTGVALVEVYDATGTNGYLANMPRLLNVSARTQVGTGNDVLIVGFSIAGEGTKRLLIRAVGPTLARFVGGTLADPELELHRQDTGALLTQNDGWNDDAAIATTANAIGAFPLDAGSKDAALLITLPSGTYSVVVRGVGDTTGVALAEVYEVP